jgi:hypothetical protein
MDHKLSFSGQAYIIYSAQDQAPNIITISLNQRFTHTPPTITGLSDLYHVTREGLQFSGYQKFFITFTLVQDNSPESGSNQFFNIA